MNKYIIVDELDVEQSESLVMRTIDNPNAIMIDVKGNKIVMEISAVENMLSTIKDYISKN